MAADLSAVQAYQAAVRAAQQSTGGTKEAEQTPALDFGNMVSSAIADTSGTIAKKPQVLIGVYKAEVSQTTENMLKFNMNRKMKNK